MTKRRVDTLLVDRGLAETQAKAQALVLAGQVRSGEKPVAKPGHLIDDALALAVDLGPRYVSRGGEKLEHALAAFNLDVAGLTAADVGASTGGFTDVLLRAGAGQVVAVDVGYGQLAWELRTDPRVTVMERTNVRELRLDLLPYRPSVVTADLSFISLGLAVGPLITTADPLADLVLLVKPQFEVERDKVERGGVVRDPAQWRRTIDEVAEATLAAGAAPAGLLVSPVRGPAGNVEFLLHARAAGEGTSLDVDGAIEAAGHMVAS